MNPVKNKSTKRNSSVDQASSSSVSIPNGMKNITLFPRMSEKAYQMSQAENIKTYIFEVPLSANKHTVARALTAQYDVTVTNVRTTILKGKPKQSYRKGGRPLAGFRSDIKKAYITLKSGDTLPLFVEEAAEELKQSKATEKAASKATKKTEKESK